MDKPLDRADLLASYILDNLPSDLAICERSDHEDYRWVVANGGEASRWLAKLIREYNAKNP